MDHHTHTQILSMACHVCQELEAARLFIRIQAETSRHRQQRLAHVLAEQTARGARRAAFHRMQLFASQQCRAKESPVVEKELADTTTQTAPPDVDAVALQRIPPAQPCPTATPRGVYYCRPLGAGMTLRLVVVTVSERAALLVGDRVVRTRLNGMTYDVSTARDLGHSLFVADRYVDVTVRRGGRLVVLKRVDLHHHLFCTGPYCSVCRRRSVSSLLAHWQPTPGIPLSARSHDVMSKREQGLAQPTPTTRVADETSISALSAS